MTPIAQSSTVTDSRGSHIASPPLLSEREVAVLSSNTDCSALHRHAVQTNQLTTQLSHPYFRDHHRAHVCANCKMGIPVPNGLNDRRVPWLPVRTVSCVPHGPSWDCLSIHLYIISVVIVFRRRHHVRSAHPVLVVDCGSAGASVCVGVPS